MVHTVSFPLELEIAPGKTICFDIEAEVDPGEATSYDCPGADACVDDITISYEGTVCNEKTMDKRLYAICWAHAEDSLMDWEGPEA